jgi:hypothetical protein
MPHIPWNAGLGKLETPYRAAPPFDGTGVTSQDASGPIAPDYSTRREMRESALMMEL